MKDREPNIPEEVKLAEIIREARQIYICGNGGSASTSEHFATDLVKKGIRANAFTANTSVITMIGNDYGYDQIFSKQVELFATPEDLLITISCSGTSPNVVNAQQVALAREIPVYAFEVFKEGDRDFGKLENEHLRFAHAVSALL